MAYIYIYVWTFFPLYDRHITDPCQPIRPCFKQRKCTLILPIAWLWRNWPTWIGLCNFYVTEYFFNAHVISCTHTYSHTRIGGLPLDIYVFSSYKLYKILGTPTAINKCAYFLASSIYLVFMKEKKYSLMENHLTFYVNWCGLTYKMTCGQFVNIQWHTGTLWVMPIYVS